VIDLRSDTVPQPSAAMREIMAAAAVGDDDYHDDPTVNRLEERAAEVLGKEAGLFVPSGLMSNLVAALTHCPGDHRVVALINSHIVWSLTEQARIGGLVRLTTIASDERGLPYPDELRTQLDAVDAPPVGLLCYENSHNQAGGTALAPAETADLIAAARERGIPVHLDGARLFNAAVALGLPASVLAREADSATFCVSKGLGAPIGSVLCGTAAFVDRARDFRKFLGGTMRQVGIVAAAGLYALDHGIERLAEDHENARWLADQLRSIPGLRVVPEHIETNLVYLRHDHMPADELVKALLAHGVMSNATDGLVRLVTHLDVDRAALGRAVEAFRTILAPNRGPDDTPEDSRERRACTDD
jgi:threonine aldolase